jgi:hypothetical protein
MDNLENVIEDSINDSVNPDTTPEVDATPEVDTDVTSPAAAVNDEVTDAVDAPVEDSQVPAPGSPATKQQDDFDKKYGLQSQSVTGRENRIPYSRVKKIVAKAEAEANKFKTELDTIKPRFTEYETKVQDYESRLERVAQFEEILQNDPKQFLTMLSKVPAYKEFFDFVNQAVSGQAAPAGAVAAPVDQPDGLYSMEGLKKLLAWQADQVEQRTIKQVEQRYAPIEQAWQSQEQMARIVPVVEKQIAEARTWDRFSELEPRIVEILKADKNINLDRAYMKAYQEVIVPQLRTDKDKMRADLLAEIQKAPKASSPAAMPVKPKAVQSDKPRSIEQIIKDEIEASGIK